MESVLSPELRELVGRAREITQSVVAPAAAQADAEAEWPESTMRALADAGLMGLNVPTEQGGHGEGMLGVVAISETLAQESPSAALCFAMHCVGTAVIAAKATDHQKSAYLEPIARGEHITTLALSEPGTGLHFYVPETQLARAGEDYTVTGTKSFITNGGHADSYVVSTTGVEPSAGDGAFSCVLVHGNADGLEWKDSWHGLGMRSNSSRTAALRGVRVPARDMLGNQGDQLWYVFEVIAPYFLMAMAGTYTGVATCAVDLAREHLGSRRHTHTGELLGMNPVMAHRLGDIWADAQRTRHLVYHAAAAGDGGRADSLIHILACKAAAGETAVRVTNEAMTIGGGTAYRDNSKLARLLRDARASHVMSPTTDMLKTWTGRALLQLPLL